MKRKILSLLLAPIAMLAMAAAPNWGGTVTLGANGSHVIGNPKARVRVVEYFSYTCSHCAEFAMDAAGKYRTGAIARGDAAYELRNAARDRIDLGAAVIARCGGPAKFMGNTEAIFAAQHAWMGQAIAFDTKNGASLIKMTSGQAIQAIVNGTGLKAVMQKRGFTPAQINACAADPAAIKAVLAMDKDADERVKVPYTPYFVINGNETDRLSSWTQMEAMIGFYLGRS